MFILFLITLTTINRFGIISALDEELTLIKEDMQIEKVDTVAQRIFIVGKIDGLDCFCVKAGVGKVNAALTAEILILKYNIDALIFTGVAGGINPKLNIGDIVISKKIVHHDFGIIMPHKFEPFDTIGFLADSLLIEIAQEAAEKTELTPVPEKIGSKENLFPKFVIGRIATGDQFIASEQKRQWLEKLFHADCVEMEGAAVAQVCNINKVPFVIIRCLSDLANEKADVDFEAFLPYAAKNSSLLVQEIIKLIKK